MWIKYFDIRTSIMLVCKEFCLGLFAPRNLWMSSFDGDMLYPYNCEVFYDAVSSSRRYSSSARMTAELSEKVVEGSGLYQIWGTVILFA